MPRWRQKCHGLLTRTKPRKSEKQKFLEKVAAGRFTSVSGDGGLVTGLWPNRSLPHQTPVTHTWPPQTTLLSALSLCCSLSSKCPSLLFCPWRSPPLPRRLCQTPPPSLAGPNLGFLSESLTTGWGTGVGYLLVKPPLALLGRELLESRLSFTVKIPAINLEPGHGKHSVKIH